MNLDYYILKGAFLTNRRHFDKPRQTSAQVQHYMAFICRPPSRLPGGVAQKTINRYHQLPGSQFPNPTSPLTTKGRSKTEQPFLIG